MADIQVFDNFLPEQEWNDIWGFVTDAEFSWFYNRGVLDDQLDGAPYQFTHTLVRAFTGERSWAAPLLEPILLALNYPSVTRAKLNLGPRDSIQREGGFHTDMPDHTTGIFYLNTTNGYTKFADGTVVEGIGNRFVEFDSNLEHTGVSHTDEQVRVVLNVNYRAGVPVNSSTATV